MTTARNILRFMVQLDLIVALTVTTLDRPVLLIWLLAALVLHETGHALTAIVLGLPPTLRVRLSGVRVAVHGHTDRQGLLVAVGGPCMSLITGAVFLGAHVFTLGVVSVCAGLVSLVPIKPMDGYLAWRFATKLVAQHA